MTAAADIRPRTETPEQAELLSQRFRAPITFVELVGYVAVQVAFLALLRSCIERLTAEGPAEWGTGWLLAGHGELPPGVLARCRKETVEQATLQELIVADLGAAA